MPVVKSLLTRPVVIAMAGAAIVALGIGLLLWRSHVKALEKQQALRNAAYAVAIEQYQRDLKVGMGRAQVKQFLESRRIEYEEAIFGGSGTNGWSYIIPLAREPANTFWCESWNVYVALNFDTAERHSEPAPQDILNSISIHKVGKCL